jgi:DNA helicase-2/ATP-dependent DNA helicase PcrA
MFVFDTQAPATAGHEVHPAATEGHNGGSAATDARTDQRAPQHSELNERQREAVEHRGGPLLMIAGAGSGKTRTLAARVAHLIEEGVQPERILLLTFTRRAATDMLRRAESLVAAQRGDRTRSGGTGRVWGGTFHGVAHRLLRRHPAAVGLRQGFTVLDQADCESLFGLLRTEMDLAESGVRFPRKETIAAIYSRVVNAQTKLTTTLDERFPWCRGHAEDLRDLFRAYTERKRTHNVIDYDDLLLYWRALLESDAGAAIRSRFDHVLVDEYQDTNVVQAEILTAMFEAPGADGAPLNLTVVGDDAQAIYSFRAAEVENILSFAGSFPGTRVVTLEQNYRSTPEILAVANAVMTRAERGFRKNLYAERPSGSIPELITCRDPAEEAGVVCDQILERREHGVDLRDQAVLFRTGHHSDALELELSRRDIPFIKFGGLKFLETAHVKDLVALLRILDNPEDELAWHRVLQMVPGIGPATATSIMEAARRAAETGGQDQLRAFIDLEPAVRAEAAEPLRRLRSALAGAAAGPEDVMPPAAQIDLLLSFCNTTFAARYDDAVARLGDLEALAQLAAGHARRADFLADLVLDPPQSTSDLAGPPHLDDDYLTLSTVHSAKGAEWDSVYVIHAADGNIPSDMALSEPGGVDEELRVFYVALTRAKHHLTITVPQRFYHHRNPGNPAHSYALPSRFLDAARPHLQARPAAGALDPESPQELSADPVAPILDALWD